MSSSACDARATSSNSGVFATTTTSSVAVQAPSRSSYSRAPASNAEWISTLVFPEAPAKCTMSNTKSSSAPPWSR
ncbi:MAG: hypothetical protein ACRDGR_03610 [bacterium]